MICGYNVDTIFKLGVKDHAPAFITYMQILS